MKGLFRRLGLALLGLVLGLNLYLANARMLGDPLPMPFGVGAAVVMSGSMEPALKIGDLIFVRETETIQPGDIVVYRSGASLIVHRVKETSGDTLITQGDANNAPDEPVTREQVKGTVALRIGGAGKVLTALRSPAGIAAVLILIVTLTELSFRKEKKKADTGTEELKAEIRRLKEEMEK